MSNDLGNLSVLGSTGSVGTQTLDVVRRNPEQYQVCALAASKNVELIVAQAEEFHPQYIAMEDAAAAEAVRNQVSKEILVESGPEAVENAASLVDVHTVVGAIVGFAALRPVIRAIEMGKHVALGNKECIVAAGNLIDAALQKSSAILVPLDSEHSGVFQCLRGRGQSSLRRVVITASGGPFLNTDIEALRHVKPEEAVKHPKWDMGAKISIDSATLMNKGLEVIEAAKMFSLTADQIEVIVHPQTLVHAFAEYKDGTIVSSLFETDMRIPIAFALGYLRSENPKDYAGQDHSDSGVSFLDLVSKEPLEFYQPDTERFPSLSLCYEALRAGGGMPAVLNAANEIAVSSFLAGEIGFLVIPRLVAKVMAEYDGHVPGTIEEIVEVDSWARRVASNVVNNKNLNSWAFSR